MWTIICVHLMGLSSCYGYHCYNNTQGKLKYYCLKKIVSTNSLCKNCPYSELFSSIFSHTRTEYGEIWSISLYLVQIQKNADQNNSEYGHFLRRDSLLHIGRIKTKFTEQRIGHSSIKYQNLKHLFCEDDNTISLFWSCI